MKAFGYTAQPVPNVMFSQEATSGQLEFLEDIRGWNELSPAAWELGNALVLEAFGRPHQSKTKGDASLLIDFWKSQGPHRKACERAIAEKLEGQGVMFDA